MKIKSILLLILFSTLISCNNHEEITIPDGWDKLDGILAKIVPPTFPDKNYNVLDFGANPNDKSDDRKAINDAITECSKNGGGIVNIPPGEFHSNGPILLLSNVNLKTAEGTIVFFSTDPNDYLPVVKTRWEGMDLYNYSPLIYAYRQENIAVTGKGIFHGQGAESNWWSWKGRKETGWTAGMPSQSDANSRPLLMEMNNKNVPVEERVFGDGTYLRPNFIQPYECKKILIEDVTFIDSPMWFIHPVLCENITIKGVTTEGQGPNNDGCDPESCNYVLIKDCYFNTGDDCIAIKSGRNSDGRRVAVASENIVIQDCVMKDGHGGVVIGSEISGDCRNVYAENCEMDSPNLDRAIRLKSNSVRGGIIENIFVRNIKIGEVREAVLKINTDYDPKEIGPRDFPPTMRNVHLENIESSKSKYGLLLIGLENSQIENIFVSNSKFDGVEKGNSITNVKNLILEDLYINGELQN